MVCAACAIAALLFACGGSDAGPSAFASADRLVRADSAGVEVVSIPRAVLDSLPIRRVEVDPTFVVGALEGPEEEVFGYVSDASLLSEGRLAVADAGQKRILVFAPDGGYSHSIGGPGEGPGEFGGGSIIRMAARGDTLVVTDPSSRRLQALLVDGTYLEARQVGGGAGTQIGLVYGRPHRWSFPFIYWITPDGYPRGAREGDGPHRVLQILARYDTLGGSILDTVRSADRWMVELDDEARRAAVGTGVPIMLGNVMAHPLSPDAHAAFLDGRPVTAWSSWPEVWVHGATGGLERRIRFDAGPELPVGDPRLREWAVGWKELSARPLARRAWDVLERPDTLARLFGLRTGPEGHVWVAVEPEEVAEADPFWTRWLRLEPGGDPVEWVLTPSVEIVELGPRGLVALRRDDLGVQRVAVHGYEPDG